MGEENCKMLDVECFTQLLYIQRITKDTSILQASLLIPSPSCLVYRGENLPPFYTLRSLQSYIIDLFSLAAFSYKANNFTPSFIARVERPILLVIMFSSTSMLLKKKEKENSFSPSTFAPPNHLFSSPRKNRISRETTLSPPILSAKRGRPVRSKLRNANATRTRGTRRKIDGDSIDDCQSRGGRRTSL